MPQKPRSRAKLTIVPSAPVSNPSSQGDANAPTTPQPSSSSTPGPFPNAVAAAKYYGDKVLAKAHEIGRVAVN